MKRTPMPARVTPLLRTAPLHAAAGLDRRVPLRQAGIKDAAAKKGTRYTGPDRLTRALVLERDGYACVCCGTPIAGRPYSLQHRKRRSQGGGNSPSNLVVVLGTGTTGCHERIDSRRDPGDEAKGYTCRSWQDPALVPVEIRRADGRTERVWLWDDGRYHQEAPQGVAA